MTPYQRHTRYVYKAFILALKELRAKTRLYFSLHSFMPANGNGNVSKTLS